MYFIVDANIVAGYYLPQSLNTQKERDKVKLIFKYFKKNKIFVYIPNICIAETFNVFAKYSFGKWNRQIKKTKPIDTRTYLKIVKKFENDIHNGKFLYHYELNRYHILNSGFISPIDNHYQYSKRKSKKLSKTKNNVKPMGTFDHLIISMAMELVHIHGKENVCLISLDSRLTNILKICNKGIPKNIIEKLKLKNIASRVRGKEFSKNIFPNCLNLKTCSKDDLDKYFNAILK